MTTKYHQVRSDNGHWVSMLILMVCSIHSAGLGAIYVCAPDGDDNNPGTDTLPWATIGKAVSTAQPGDVVLVKEGRYAERVSTARGGMSPWQRIVFRAWGTVEMRGWVVNHPYVTVEGFHITGHSAGSVLDAHVRVNNGGDFFELRQCTVRDGIQIVLTNAFFEADPPAIHSPSGGFVEGRFGPGQMVWVGPAGAGVTITNQGQYYITNVTDQRLYVTSPLVNEGPRTVYLSSSLIYGIYLASGSEGCVIQGNVFRNLGYDGWLITGRDHIIESNLVERLNGWDALHFGGTNLMFRWNIFRDSPLAVYQTSPDVWENNTVPYADVTFSNNFVLGFQGVLAAQKAPYTMHGLRIVRNVFVDVGRFSLTQRDTILEQNTFLRVARRSNPVVSRASHPIHVDATKGATNIVIRNNIFVDCGEPTGPIRPEYVGWYEVKGPTETIVAVGNFVTGGPPEYGSKSGWPEAPQLNGGDPGFVNIEDPLGPDGLPFTADDGLRLRPDSKLLGTGVGGAAIGAYELPYVESVPLVVMSEANGRIRVRWPRSIWDWTLESASDLGGPWTPWPAGPELRDGAWEVAAERTQASHYFRLRR